MASGSARSKVVVIVGPTASGKSGLAIQTAKSSKGEIISADSLTIYKDMNIGTAQPTPKEQAGIKHWGFDLLGPGKRWTAADFKQYAEQKIGEITDKGRLPIVVGGTGLYVDGLIFDFSYSSEANPALRQKLESKTVEQLQAMIKRRGYAMPTNATNKRHLIGVIERRGHVGSKLKKLPSHIILVGMLPETETLKQRIGQRVEQMFDDGLVAETKKLIKIYGRDSLLAKAKVAYGPVVEFIEGQLDLEQAKERLKVVHWQYARRQRTWLKRNQYIKWFDNPQVAHRFIRGEIAKK